MIAEFARRRDGAVVGRGTMQRYGWKPGDQVTLDSRDWELALTFTIVGEIPTRARAALLFPARVPRAGGGGARLDSSTTRA